MKMNRNMMSICRGVVSSIAGVDNKTMADVLSMRMRSAGADTEEGRTIVDAVLKDQIKATEDFAY